MKSCTQAAYRKLPNCRLGMLSRFLASGLDRRRGGGGGDGDARCRGLAWCLIGTMGLFLAAAKSGLLPLHYRYQLVRGHQRLALGDVVGILGRLEGRPEDHRAQFADLHQTINRPALLERRAILLHDVTLAVAALHDQVGRADNRHDDSQSFIHRIAS